MFIFHWTWVSGASRNDSSEWPGGASLENLQNQNLLTEFQEFHYVDVLYKQLEKNKSKWKSRNHIHTPCFTVNDTDEDRLIPVQLAFLFPLKEKDNTHDVSTQSVCNSAELTTCIKHQRVLWTLFLNRDL